MESLILKRGILAWYLGRLECLKNELEFRVYQARMC